jgi:hypothetical protein
MIPHSGTMRNPDNEPLDDMLFDCSRELFASYELDLQPCSRDEFPAPEDLAFCGVMGFGGKQLRGALVLATTREPLERTSPAGLTSQRDWVCELANQLMGRIKNRLLVLGVEVLLSTPSGLSGNNLSPGQLRAPQVFKAATGFVCVWIDYEVSEGFELPAAPSGGVEPAVGEGETIIF